MSQRQVDVAGEVQRPASTRWPYCVDANRPTLEALVTYLDEQHLSARRMRVEELFAPNAADGFAAYMGGDHEYLRLT